MPWHIVFEVIRASQFMLWLWFLVAVDLLSTLIDLFVLISEQKPYHFIASDTGCVTLDIHAIKCGYVTLNMHAIESDELAF